MTEAPTFLRVMIRAVNPVTPVIPSLVSRVVSSVCLSPSCVLRLQADENAKYKKLLLLETSRLSVDTA